MIRPLYTWRDVEREVAEVANPPWIAADAGPSSLTLTCIPERWSDATEKLRELFGPRFTGERLRLESLPDHERFVDVIFIPATEDLPPQRRIVRPLWSDALLPDETAPEGASSVRLAAFFSYKGGVGRTTCLLATAAALLQGKGQVLVVDADLEAPGLTWNLKGPADRLSLLDALGLIHDEEEWRERTIPLIAAELRRNRETLELPSGRVFFHFLPAFRDFEQVFSMPVSFEQLVRARGRAHIVGDAFLALGEALGVDVVLVDLRAGITEFSSPLLLDRRVQSFLVTSCSQQSIEGTVETLRRMKPRVSSAAIPEVILSLVPPGEPESLLSDLAERLISALPVARDEPGELELRFHTVNFAQELLHYASIEELLANRVPGTDLGKNVAPALAAMLLPEVAHREESEPPRPQLPGLRRVIEEAKKLEYAETSGAGGLLPTNALIALVQDTATSLPAAVVLGSKGAGKTFAWLQMVTAGTWQEFCRRVQPEAPGPADGLVFPLLTPLNLDPFGREAIRDAEKNVWDKLSPGVSTDKLRDTLERLGEKGEQESATFWPRWVAARLGLPEDAGMDVETLAATLEKRSCPIVLALDGFEDAFQVSPTEPLNTEKRRILRSLLQVFLARLRELRSLFLGAIILIRRDLAEDSIPQNFGQFEGLYQRFNLVWSPTEALRLAAWLLARAGRPVLDAALIASASYDDLKLALQDFWGVQMGSERSREAYTDRWVIAALSDLQGRLQPRDIVRLIRFAAEHDDDAERLNAQALRNALSRCSEEKIRELEQEVQALRPLFDRFRKADPEAKVIPFTPADFELTDQEAGFLQRQGIATSLKDDPEIYMPEIIRQGLGFKLKLGRRAKVLLLYRQAQLKNR